MEQNKQPWQVKLEVLEQEMYCYPGQEIDDMVMAENREEALSETLKNNQLSEKNVKVLGIQLYT